MRAFAAAAAVLLLGAGPAWAGRYVDPAGWSLTVPRGMAVERSGVDLRLSIRQVTVASFPLRDPIRSGSTPRTSWLRVDPPSDRHGRFPDDGVAFRVVRTEGGPAPDVEAPESRFPLRLTSFGRSDTYGGSMPPTLGRRVVADGVVYRAQAWVGSEAPASLRSKLRRLVSSLAFPHPRVGAVVGAGFTVLEPANRYPVGTFVLVRAQGQPFWLVHAPGGFYAVGWRRQASAGGYKSRCDLRLDPVRREFFCANMRARWDRVGRVLERPPGAARNDPLDVAVAKPAWDGHVLLFAGTARFADARYERKLWR